MLAVATALRPVRFPANGEAQTDRILLNCIPLALTRCRRFQHRLWNCHGRGREFESRRPRHFFLHLQTILFLRVAHSLHTVPQ
jgi:hypothetical protein